LGQSLIKCFFDPHLKHFLTRTLANEDTEPGYDSGALREEIQVRYPRPSLTVPPINIPSSKPNSSGSAAATSSSSRLQSNFNPYSNNGNITPPIPSSGSTTPTGTPDIIRLKASVDRIASSMSATVSVLSDLRTDLHRIANAITGGERKGIVEAIQALQQGINLDEEDEDSDEETDEKLPATATSSKSKKRKINNTTQPKSATAAKSNANANGNANTNTNTNTQTSRSPSPIASPSSSAVPIGTTASNNVEVSVDSYKDNVNSGAHESVQQEITNAEAAENAKGKKRAKHNK